MNTVAKDGKVTVTQDALDATIDETIRRQTVEWTVADSGETMSASISTVRKLFANPTKQGKHPTDKDCWLFLQLCKSRGLNPYVGDAFLVGYDTTDGPKFNLITAHQALLKRAERTGQKDGMESGVTLIDKQTGEVVDWQGDFYLEETHTLVGGWCRVYRKDQKVPIYDRLKLATFNKGFGLWKTNAAGLIVKCAEASAHRLAFPIETGGLYTREEMHVHEFDAEPARTPAKAVTRSTLNDPVDAMKTLSQVIAKSDNETEIRNAFQAFADANSEDADAVDNAARMVDERLAELRESAVHV